jgi:hypothetical protein
MDILPIFTVNKCLLPKNPKELVFGFTKKHQFTTKSNRNFAFLDRKTNILDRLYIMVSYISFFGCKKKFKFLLKIQMG